MAFLITGGKIYCGACKHEIKSMGTSRLQPEERIWNTIKASIYIMNIYDVRCRLTSKVFCMAVRLFAEMTTGQI